MSTAKVHVFSDSVLCLGKTAEYPRSVTSWKGQIEWFTQSPECRELDGVLMENQSCSSGKCSLHAPHCRYFRKSPMRHAYGFVPHNCCAACACVVAGVRHFNLCLRGHLVQGGWEGAQRGAGVALLFTTPARPWRRANPARQNPVNLERGLDGVLQECGATYHPLGQNK